MKISEFQRKVLRSMHDGYRLCSNGGPEPKDAAWILLKEDMAINPPTRTVVVLIEAGLVETYFKPSKPWNPPDMRGRLTDAGIAEANR